MMPSRATGVDLDRIGDLYGVRRKKWLWFIPEFDFLFRKRIRTFLKGGIRQ